MERSPSREVISMLNPQRVTLTLTPYSSEMGPIFYALLDPKPDRENGKLRLKVGTHEGCEGMIVYESQFVEGGPRCAPSRDVECPCRQPWPLIGPYPKMEKVKCFCVKCKLKFNPFFPYYRDQVLAFRECKA